LSARSAEFAFFSVSISIWPDGPADLCEERSPGDFMMQRDQKVGLALGVLLIGAVAAFFFRNEPDPAGRIPHLESAQEVNREIAEKRLIPYFSETESADPSRAAPTRPASDSRNLSDARTGERKLPRWEELRANQDDPFGEGSGGAAVPAPAPDPVRFETSQTRVDPMPDHNHAWNPAGDEAKSSPTATALIHEVQRGETLSSIAGKYLGSQARYRELFEANKDQLRDANDLQVGMKLRIPDARGKSADVDFTPPKTEKKPGSRVKVEAAKPDAAESDLPEFSGSPSQTGEESAIGRRDKKTDAPPSSEPPKIQFTPAKRRYGRAPSKPAP
jgi:hypothetical protein